MSSRRAAACWWFSQFTLAADTERGYDRASRKALPLTALEALYEYFVARCRQQEMHTQTGRFAADMRVSLVVMVP